jgi:hypothetical protein
VWCPDHNAPISNVTGCCWQCRLEWEATDQAVAARAARAALHAPAHRIRPGDPVPPTDADRLERIRAELDAAAGQVPGQLPLELEVDE